MTSGGGSIRRVEIFGAAGGGGLPSLPVPLLLAEMAGGRGPWELEIGFGKGRYLLARAAAEPRRRFLGIERAASYFRLAARRARRRGLENLVLLRGDALYLLSAVLPRAFAAAVHVYFPDPWPKSRHGKRRLFEPGSLDLVVGALAPGGRLWFATDFLAYGETVSALLGSYPGARVVPIEGGWEGGPRTNYEAKYVREGRPICRLAVEFAAADAPLHPLGRDEVVAATAARSSS